jgi:molybdopterin converting factor small subunit
MKSVHIRVFGNIQKFLGMRNITIRTKAVTLKDLIKDLSKISEKDLAEVILDDKERVNPRYRIFHNGKDVTDLLEVSHVEEGDHIMIFPIIDGG